MSKKSLTVGDLRDLINKHVEEHGASIYNNEVILWVENFDDNDNINLTEARFETFGHGELWLS